MPVYVHDCGACRFLGHEDGYDFYVCPGRDPSVLARYGSDGCNYLSQSADMVRSNLGRKAGPNAVLLRRALELSGVQS